MNVQRFQRLCNCKYFNRAQKFRSAHQLKSEAAEVEFLPKQDAKISLIENGIKVASVENYSPVTQVAVVIKAGSRYENPQNLGVVHCLRNASVFSTKNHSAFSLTRNIEMLGSKLWVTGTRDHLIYTLQCARDEVDPGLEILSEVTNKQVLKDWELVDSIAKLHLDIAMFQNNPNAVLNEILHKVAFRGGLSNSLYSPSWMTEKYNTEMLYNFLEENFTISKISVVALGISHDHLQDNVNKLFNFDNKVINTNYGASKFTPGEVRQEADIQLVHAALVSEGAGINNIKEALSLAALECLLGMGSELKMSSPKLSKLGAAAANTTTNPFHVKVLNINYADTGLFGVHIVGCPGDMGGIMKAVVAEMKQVTKHINESSVEIAKHKLKAKILFKRETSLNTLFSMAADMSELGQLRDVKDLLKAVDDLKSSDIQTVAGRVIKAKPAMAALGQLYATPHVDELI